MGQSHDRIQWEYSPPDILEAKLTEVSLGPDLGNFMGRSAQIPTPKKATGRFIIKADAIEFQ